MTKEQLIVRLSEEVCFQFNEFIQLEESLLNDKEVIIRILKSNNDLFEYVPTFFKDDIEVAYTAIQRNGYPFVYASERLQNDRTYVLEAAKNGIGENYQYLSDNFKNDLEIATLALNHDPYGMIDFITDKLKNHYEFMLLAISKCGDVAAFECSEDLLSNKDFVLKAIEICPNSYMSLQPSENSLAKDKDVIILTLKEMLAREYYRTEYLYDNIFSIVTEGGIKENLINELLGEVKKLCDI